MADRDEIETMYNRLTDPDRRCEECLSPIAEDGHWRFISLALDGYRLLYSVCKRCNATDLPNITKDAYRIRERLVSKSLGDFLMADHGGCAVIAPMTVKQDELETISKWMNVCSACKNPLEGEYGELLIQKIAGKNLLHSICGGCRGRGLQAHKGLAISEAAVKLVMSPPVLVLLVQVTKGRTTVKIRQEGFTQVSLESAHPFDLRYLFTAKDARRLQKWLDRHLGPECKCSNCRDLMRKEYPADEIPYAVNSFLFFCAPSGFRYVFLCEDCSEHWFEADEAGIPQVATKLSRMSARLEGVIQ